MASMATAEAQAWHAMRRHMLVIADALLDGIAKQFPARFAPRIGEVSQRTKKKPPARAGGFVQSTKRVFTG